MSFIAKNPLSLPEIDYTPSTPSGTRGLYPKEDGWYDVDGNGNVKKILDSDELNTKLSSVYKYKGTIDYYFELPQSSEVGDVYNVKNASGEGYYEEEPILYPNYNIEEAHIPPFKDSGLSGFYIRVEFDSKPDFMNGETLDVGVYAPSHESTMTGFKVLILDSCPYPATSCAYWDGSCVYIFVVDSESPFNGESYSGYDTKCDEIYDYIINHPWNPDEKPSLHFNNEMKLVPRLREPYKVKDGDNVAWNGEEWDALGGTVDMSLYVQTDLSNVDNATFKAKAESAGVGGGSGGGNKDFIVNFTIVDESLKCTTDKTFEEVQVAIQAGYNVYGAIGITINDVYGNVKVPLTISNEYGCWFTGIHLDRSLSIYLTQNGECGADLIYVADKAEEIYEEDVDSKILGENQPKLFKVSRSRMGLMTGFNPYYVYSGEISSAVDGQATKLYQYKITYDGIYFRTGAREPFVAQNNWMEWAAIGSDSIDLSDCEKISNKTTEINADSTDDQYPSAKAVWEVTKNAGGAVSSVNGKTGAVELRAEDVDAYTKLEVNNMIGDIENTLENIIAKYGLGGDKS